MPGAILWKPTSVTRRIKWGEHRIGFKLPVLRLVKCFNETLAEAGLHACQFWGIGLVIAWYIISSLTNGGPNSS